MISSEPFSRNASQACQARLTAESEEWSAFILFFYGQKILSCYHCPGQKVTKKALSWIKKY